MRLLITVMIIFVMTSCKNGNKEPMPDDTILSVKLTPKSILNDTATACLVLLIDDYYGIKDALVADKAEQADKMAGKLYTNADKLETLLETDSANSLMLKGHLLAIKKHNNEMIAMKTKNCEYKRIPFQYISSAMYKVLKKAELKNITVYKQYCPMAFNDKGAIWLSNTKEIRNPYFGKKMLESGEITDIIR